MNQNKHKSRYTKIKKIGQGTYGSVTQVYDNQMQKIVALKKIKFISDDQGIPINALRQITLLKYLQHDNIIKINEIYYYWLENKLYINLQYFPQNLFQFYKRNFPLSPNLIKNYMFQIFQATYYMHSKLVMHRDFKPQNILISQTGKIKVCDLGQSKIYPFNHNQHHSSSIATLWYRAPQVLLGAQQYDFGVDIWALGCIFAELITGTPLFKSQSQIGQIFRIFQICGTPKLSQDSTFKQYKHMSCSFPKFIGKQIYFNELQEQGNNLLQQMLELNPHKRISIGKILKNNYFSDY